MSYTNRLMAGEVKGQSRSRSTRCPIGRWWRLWLNTWKGRGIWSLTSQFGISVMKPSRKFVSCFIFLLSISAHELLCFGLKCRNETLSVREDSDFYAWVASLCDSVYMFMCRYILHNVHLLGLLFLWLCKGII